MEEKVIYSGKFKIINNLVNYMIILILLTYILFWSFSLIAGPLGVLAFLFFILGLIVGNINRKFEVTEKGIYFYSIAGKKTDFFEFEKIEMWAINKKNKTLVIENEKSSKMFSSKISISDPEKLSELLTKYVPTKGKITVAGS